MGKELLFEVGTEEIPAGIVPRALKELKTLAEDKLNADRVGYSKVKVLGTPRRLFLYIDELSERQQDIVEEKLGPAKKSAYDANGNPTMAAMGFAKALGVDVEDLQTVDTEKGEYLSVKKEIKGEETFNLLSGILKDLINSLTFPKPMRWGSSTVAFIRPVHWILSTFGGEVIPLSIGNLKSSSTSRGHLFKSPESFQVGDYSSYIKKIREAYVIIDHNERKKIIEDGLKGVAEETGSRVLEDRQLVEEVTYLVEYPVVLHGSFDKEFLKLPGEVLIHAMRSHQRYFSMVNSEGNLLPKFVVVANTPVSDNAIVVKGNERVLKARLEDAKFYYNEDLKVPLEKRLEELKGVIFQAKLGTSYEKVMRFKSIARLISDIVAPDKVEKVERASLLCKADLVSGMVGEFPDLQGVMGREYAQHAGESIDVSDAIYEHYMPKEAGGELPKSLTGAIVSIADKLDTIVGCFSVGLIPTGTADPYALRRQVLGIIAIILDRGFTLSLRDLMEKSFDLLEEKALRPREEVLTDIEEFVKSRWKNQLVSQGYPSDIIDAILATSSSLDLEDAFERIKALKNFKMSPAFDALAAAFKRVVNILKGSQEFTLDPDLFDSEGERNLFNAYEEQGEEIEKLLAKKDYEHALEKLSLLKAPVDAFFDEVMVMVEDEAVRNNRLALLQSIGKMLYKICDFLKITTN